MAKKGSWSELGRAKLESSGLTKDIGDKLGMYEVASAKQQCEYFEALAGLTIPYFDIDGKPILTRNGEPFYRLRYLEKGKDFKAVAKDKPQRYAQPTRTGVEPYFPQIINWHDIAKDTTNLIIITEGELKAAAGCLQEYPTIGLGGVWNFRQSKEGIFFLPRLEKVNWTCREVYICFDSDYADNPQICGAVNALTEELEERGAYVFALLLPQGKGEEKVGLDDYFLEHSNEEFDRLLMEAEEIGMVRSLWRTNDAVVYVKDPGLIIVQETAQKMSVDSFKAHSDWSTLSTPKKVLDKEGNAITRKVSAATEWIKWPFRRSVSRLTYAPGRDKITPRNEYNIWRGWGVEPRKGDVEPWLKLTKFLFADMEKGALEYFYDWCAYQFQNPGVKMFVAVVVHGLTQGTGKSLVGYTLGEIFGENFKELADDDLELTYWAENKQFVLGDEVTGNDNRKYQSLLKRLISQRKVTVNIKFVPQYEVPDRINYFFTAQHADAFFLEDKDRRFFIVECAAEDPLPEDFYIEYQKWLWQEGGAAHLFQWMLDRKISAKFNPHAPAMRTQAKERMIHTGKGDLASWVYDLLRMPDDRLMLGQLKHTRDLFSSKELLSMYKQENPDTRATINGMSKALKNAGAHWCAGGQPLKGPDGKMDRFFAIRNVAEWKKIKDRKILERHLATAHPMKATKK